MVDFSSGWVILLRMDSRRVDMELIMDALLESICEEGIDEREDDTGGSSMPSKLFEGY